MYTSFLSIFPSVDTWSFNCIYIILFYIIIIIIIINIIIVTTIKVVIIVVDIFTEPVKFRSCLLPRIQLPFTAKSYL
jgi:hypothetical protein